MALGGMEWDVRGGGPGMTCECFGLCGQAVLSEGSCVHHVKGKLVLN